jgi:hypothetical protein
VKRFGKYALFNFQLRLELLSWPSLIINILGSLPVLIVALVLRSDVLLISIPWYDVLPMAYAAAKLSGAKLVIDVRDPLEYWLHVSRGLSRRFYSLLVILARANSRLVVTDSGGVQREAYLLRKPVVVLRKVTKRKGLADAGLALLVGVDSYLNPEKILKGSPSHYIEGLLGNADALQMICEILKKELL